LLEGSITRSKLQGEVETIAFPTFLAIGSRQELEKDHRLEPAVPPFIRCDLIAAFPGLVEKPFEVEALLSAVRKVLDG